MTLHQRMTSHETWGLARVRARDLRPGDLLAVCAFPEATAAYRLETIVSAEPSHDEGYIRIETDLTITILPADAKHRAAEGYRAPRTGASLEAAK